MKKILRAIACVSVLLSAGSLMAQPFSIAKDTVYVTIAGTAGTDDKAVIAYDNITIPGATDVNIKYHVKSTNFPADWLTNAAFGICDKDQCRNNTGDTVLYNKATGVGNYFLCSYPAATTSSFDLSENLQTATSTGCFYVTVELAEAVPGSTPKLMTYVVCKSPLSVPGVANTEDKVVLYPNPASNEVNVIYDMSADVKNIAVYNIIGKMMNVYKVTGNSANLNLENLPSGIYFVKLYSSNGGVVATRKFTKQ